MKFFENEKVLKHILKNKIYNSKVKNYNEDLDWYFKETWSSVDDDNYKEWLDEDKIILWKYDEHNVMKRILPNLIELVCDTKDEKEELLIDLSKFYLNPFYPNDEYEYIGLKKINDEDCFNLVIKNKRNGLESYINTNNKRIKHNSPGFTGKKWNKKFDIEYFDDNNKKMANYISMDRFEKTLWFSFIKDGVYNPLYIKLQEKGYIKLPTDDEINKYKEEKKKNLKENYEKWGSMFYEEDWEKNFNDKYKDDIIRNLIIKRLLEAIKQYSLIQSSIKEYRKEFNGKASAYQDLKNMTQKASNLAASTSFSRVFKKFEIDPGSDFEVIKKLEKEFNKIIPFLIEDYNKDLTLRFRKTNNLKVKGVFFPSYNNITINANKHKLDDVPHIQSFMHEYAHFIDYQLGTEIGEDNFKLPFSLSNPEFLKIHSKYVDKFNEILGENKDLINKKAYLTSHTEVFARGFERYLIEIGFESSFNRSKNHLDKIKKDVFNELDKADRDKLFEMYEGIFKIKEKWLIMI
ncbi:hypothetical protein RRG38_04515 [Mycoplasmopsis felis]|uniref:hypothetical protein n=1 Tax=Mycoplasmopsis felis TaxID=33923 RepID=UPI002AF6A44D|nr:hypothetical protein [Mycoplasmopsis felis]WQQ02438.1 hypothetical protein RNN91_03910 [Mycoplasmopsis felis]